MLIAKEYAFFKDYAVMKFSAMILSASFSLVILSTSFNTVAADRGHFAPQSIDKTRSEKALPDGWRNELSKGEVLDYDVYKKGKVVYRDPSKGTVALRLENKVVRLVESTREIVDVLHPF